MRLLVTKNIAQNFRTRILALGYSVVEYPLIRKVPLDYTPKNNFSHWIFTSSYAAQLVLEHHILKTQLSDKSIFCVGKKTAALFLENGQKVIKIAQNAAELAFASYFKGAQAIKDMNKKIDKSSQRYVEGILEKYRKIKQ
ncbi:MAG: uroporphyrinogen-III synthase [Flavobacteriaceae bacterium]